MSSHTYCLKPALKKIPEGDWFCRDCNRYIAKFKKKKENIDENMIDNGDVEVDLSFIKELLGKITKHEFSYPFVKPVTRKLAPDYGWFEKYWKNEEEKPVFFHCHRVVSISCRP